MIAWFMAAAIALVLVGLAAVAWFVSVIAATLERIGSGGASALGKITWGVRAIEGETAHLPVEATALNGALHGLAERLGQVADGLAELAEVASGQEAYRT